MNIEELLVEFKELSIKNYNATLEGEYPTVNSTANKMVRVVQKIRQQGQLKRLMEFFDDDNEGVVSKAAVFCLKSYPEKSLEIFRKLADNSKTIIGFGAINAIKHWENGTWNIE